MMYVVFDFVYFVNENELKVNTSMLNTGYES